ncbi:carboxylesterase family protein [Paraburkholderia caribensis]|uniref:carboxylesterase family protein n=2 Tax=Paraburkholderia caribensis TaxID=75105 RepID=UPI0009E9106C
MTKTAEKCFRALRNPDNLIVAPDAITRAHSSFDSTNDGSDNFYRGNANQVDAFTTLKTAEAALNLFLLATPKPMAHIISAPELQVRTALGSLLGKGNDVRRFLGIPYAAPPVGDLQWRSPQPHAGWSGVREAMNFASDSYQDADARLRGQNLSEDCLYLNVWAPARIGNETFPVMVWIHGNGYTRGSGSHVTYDGLAHT